MLPNHTDIACSLANIGEMYQYLGKYDLSLEFYKQAQSIFESLDSYIFLAQLYHDLLNVYVIKNNLQEAQANLDNLKSLSSRHGENLFVHTYFLLAEGLMLKNSTSLMTKFKAADNFLQITNNPVVDSTLTAQAIFNLNELLLLEAKLSQDEHKLNEIHIWLKKLYLLANDLNSPVLLVQTYLLDSKLKLLEFKVDEARELLLTGQELANQKGIKKFENQISRELHQLLIQEDSWNNLRTKGATLEERIDLTGLESTLDNLIRKRQERPEIVELIMNNIRPPIKNLQDFYELLTHETYITIYRQFKLGPEIYISDDLRFSKTNKIILETKAGVYFMAAVGQGNNLNEGLFGPLPFPDSQDYESIIFTTFLDDIENSDPRSKGKSYCMFVVTFPKQFESYYSNRQYLIQILNTFQRKFENLQAIKAKDIVDLKLQLIK
jgi:tetratricopeptide (TPR) repeat protein